MEKVASYTVSDKILELTEEFNRYVFDHPEILDQFPEKAVLVLLDADDESFNQANIKLAHSSSYPADAPLVYVQMKKQVRLVQQVEWQANLLPAPIAA